ncbi:MAG: hypothetical protein L0Z55_12940 [Planctomycetes bacterium]|nr:hypothetical protein [Planctomycetota bacterium]
MVIVIIGVLAAIIVPNYVDYVGRSGASTTKANLQMLRTAIQTYRSDNNGSRPGSLAALSPNYLPQVPADGITKTNGEVAIVDGTGGWVYIPASGDVRPNLAGNDAYGVAWSSY